MAHEHTPYLHGYARSDDGDGLVEVWRCRSRLAVSNLYPAGDDDEGDVRAGETLEPGNPRHPYGVGRVREVRNEDTGAVSEVGEPCTWEVKRKHDPRADGAKINEAAAKAAKRAATEQPKALARVAKALDAGEPAATQRPPSGQELFDVERAPKRGGSS